MLPLLAAAPAVIGLGQSIFGAIKASKAERNRPEYQVPDATMAATGLAGMRASNPYMPGYAQAKGNIDVAAANALQVASQGGNVAATLQGVVGQQESGLRGLAQQSAEYRDRAQSQYIGQLGELSKAQDMEFQLNEYAPYARKYQEGRDMFGAGLQNIMSGLGNLTMMKK